MKALVIAFAFAASSSIASAGAARDAHPADAGDKSTVTVIADASHIGANSLNALNSNDPWSATGRATGSDFGAVAGQLDTGLLLVALGVAAIALARPLGRLLRRHEQHRRATALASTLGQTPRG
jgi:hypothetical protein